MDRNPVWHRLGRAGTLLGILLALGCAAVLARYAVFLGTVFARGPAAGIALGG
jgi:hypothetical protein